MRESAERDQDDEQYPRLKTDERVDRALHMRLGVCPLIASTCDVLACFDIHLWYGSFQLEHAPDRNGMSFVACSGTDPSAILELGIVLLVTKDLQAKETNGSDEGRERSTRLRERTQRVEDGLVVHVPFGPRGSTIVPSSIALACLEKMQKLTPHSTTVALSGKLRPRETVMSWLRSSGRAA